MPMSGTVMSATEMVCKVPDNLWQMSWVVQVDREEQFHKDPLSWQQDEHKHWRGVAEHTPEDTQQIQTKETGKEWRGCKNQVDFEIKYVVGVGGMKAITAWGNMKEKNACGGLCLGSAIGHTWAKEKTWNSFQNRKHVLGGSANQPESRACWLPGDLASPGWTKTWKTDIISRSESKLKCDIEEGIPLISASLSPYIKWA